MLEPKTYREDVLEKLDKVVDKFESKLNFLALFGSIAKDDYDEDSDIDLLYDLEDLKLICELDDFLHEMFPSREIDLVPIEEVLREEQDIIFNSFVEGSILIYESKRLYNYLEDERILARYKRIFGNKQYRFISKAKF